MHLNNVFKRKLGKRLVAGLLTMALTIGFFPVTEVKAASMSVGDSVTFNYTGDVQSFTAPSYGQYIITCYGAKGGGSKHGNGSYTMGSITLEANETIYIYVGGSNGYNGGGASSKSSNNGGGATDIRRGGTALSNRIMVAAGGGGGTVAIKGSGWVTHTKDGTGAYTHYPEANLFTNNWNSTTSVTTTWSKKSTEDSNSTEQNGTDGSSKSSSIEHLDEDGADGCGKCTKWQTKTYYGGGGGGYYGGNQGYAGTSYIDTTVFSATSTNVDTNDAEGYATVTYASNLFGFTDQPSNVTVNELGKATFSVSVSSTGTFQWQTSTNGTTWNNVSNNSIYSGATTGTLTITKTPYSYNGYKYRCVATNSGTNITSNAVTLTVTNGLKFDSQPESKTTFDGVGVTLKALSSYASANGTFTWQFSDDGKTWSNVSGTGYSGASTNTLSVTPTLATNTTSNVKYYRCKITSKLDNREAVYSNTVTVTTVRNSYKNIIVAYDSTVEVPKTIRISEIFCTVLYEDGTMVQASGWDNLHFVINGKQVDTITVDKLGTQTYTVILVDAVDSTKSKQATLKIAGVDTTAPTWIEESCSVSEYEIVKDSSQIKPITITVAALDNYSNQSALKYALVKGTSTPSSSAWVSNTTFNLSLTKNEEYTLYVKDEQGNMTSRSYYFNVLDNVAPTIYEFVEKPSDGVHAKAVLEVTASDGVDENGTEGSGDLKYRFFTEDETINNDNDLLNVITKSNAITIMQNGTYYVEVIDKVGNTITSIPLNVTNIDNVPPAGDITSTTENGEMVVKVTAKDNKTSTSLASGLKLTDGKIDCFSIVDDKSNPVDFTIDGDASSAAAIFKADADATYIVKITDNVGNDTLLTYIAKDNLPPVVTVKSTLSADRRYGMFEISAVEEENATTKASGLKTNAIGSLDCFEVTNEAGETVNVTTKGTPDESGLYLSANAAFKTNSDEEYTIKVTDNAGNVTTVKAKLDEAILAELVDGVISGINGENLNGLSDFPDWTNGTVRLTAFIEKAENNFEWCWDYDAESDTGTWANGAYGTLNGITSSYYASQVTENGTYTAYAKDESGKVYKRSIEVTNIDKTVPTFSATVEGSYLVITAEDEGSGIDYIMIDGGSLGTIQQKYCYGAKQTEVYAAVAENGNYGITVFDMTGNRSDCVTKTVQAIEEEEYYTVTFCNYDGSVMKAELVGKGEDATPPTDVTREGYVFTGWDKPYVNITADTTITAVFVQEEDDSAGVVIGEDTYYTVDFLNYDDAVVKSERVISGGTATPPANMKREGYTFTGWDGSYANVTSNLQVKALFIKDSEDVYYTVDFLTYDDSVVKSEKVIKGGTATPPSSVTREGYIFNGWDGSYANVTSNRQVKALFIKGSEVPSEEDVYYTVDFLTYDDSVIKSEKVLSGESATPPANVTREGYTFTGWDKSYANVTSNLQVKALFVEGENSSTSSTGGTGSTTVKEGSVKNSEVGSEFTSETEETEVIEEGEGEKVILLSELTDEAMLLAEYTEKEEETEEETLQFFQEEEVADATENLETETTQSTKNVWAYVVLIGCCGAGIFYFLNKKYMWVDLPF